MFFRAHDLVEASLNLDTQHGIPLNFLLDKYQMETEWLEFKAALIPSSIEMQISDIHSIQRAQKKTGVQVSPSTRIGDYKTYYYWECFLYPVVALANSIGGALVIGIADAKEVSSRFDLNRVIGLEGSKFWCTSNAECINNLIDDVLRVSESPFKALINKSEFTIELSDGFCIWAKRNLRASMSLLAGKPVLVVLQQLHCDFFLNTGEFRFSTIPTPS